MSVGMRPNSIGSRVNWLWHETLKAHQPRKSTLATLSRLLGGSSYGKIAKRLNAEGITGKHGGSFHASTIHKIVGNDLYQVELA